jgi:hypothetical protein
MAKDNRKIAGSVRVKGEVVTDADDLEKLASPEEIQRLTERGVISGFVKEEKKKETK